MFKKIQFFILSICFGLLALPGVVGAQAFLDSALLDSQRIAEGAGYDATTENAQADLIDTIINIINIALGFIGTILFIIILWGGFRYMTAGGNDSQIEESLKWIRNGVIGVVIIAMSAGISTFVLRTVLERVFNN